ncbi:MAG: hypothetical protein KDJ47_13340 [Hyphomicrobiaceae bacterium]|nr:hypothetical protein [Hyphomicrobiaceae bacterium]
MELGVLQESVLVEAIIDTRTQIDFIWQVFITVHIALFALLFIYSEAVDRWNFMARFFAMAGVGLFEWINGKALVSAYLLLDAMHDQYRVLYGQPERFQPRFYEQFVLAQYADRPDMVMVTHGLALTTVFIVLVARHLIHRSAN